MLDLDISKNGECLIINFGKRVDAVNCDEILNSIYEYIDGNTNFKKLKLMFLNLNTFLVLV